jgi:hypothetical protein
MPVTSHPGESVIHDLLRHHDGLSSRIRVGVHLQVDDGVRVSHLES